MKTCFSFSLQRNNTLLLCLTAALFIVGCRRTAPFLPDRQTPTTSRVSSSGLTLTLTADKTHAAVGESIRVELDAQNTGEEPITINAPSQAKMLVTLWRYTPLGWERLKEYPQDVISVRSPWRLAPGQSRTFQMNVPVTVDWPALEVLRLTAELNGRMDLRPFLLVDVTP